MVLSQNEPVPTPKEIIIETEKPLPTKMQLIRKPYPDFLERTPISKRTSSGNQCFYKEYQLPPQQKNVQVPKIFMLKTLRTGGTTFAGILRRIARNHNLTALYPYNKISFDSIEDVEKAIDNLQVEMSDVDILCNNIVHNSKLIEKILGPNYFKVSLFRNPIQRSLSGYYYSRITPQYCSDADLLRWLQNCAPFRNGISQTFIDKGIPRAHHITIFESYDHYMITERFTESLLVLMAKLNLNIQDILYISSNNLTYPESVLLNDSEKEIFETEVIKSNAADYYLWTQANQRLSMEIEKLPFEFQGMKIVFEEMIQDIQQTCNSQKDMEDCFWIGQGCAKSCIDNWIEKNIVCE